MEMFMFGNAAKRKHRSPTYSNVVQTVTKSTENSSSDIINETVVINEPKATYEEKESQTEPEKTLSEDDIEKLRAEMVEMFANIMKSHKKKRKKKSGRQSIKNTIEDSNIMSINNTMLIEKDAEQKHIAVENVENALNTLQQKVDTSLKKEKNKKSKKYKMLSMSRKILRVIKYPVLTVVGSVGSYAMFNQLMDPVFLSSSNATMILTSVMFSAVNTVADILFK